MTSLNNVIFYSVTAVFAIMAGWIILLDTPDQTLLLTMLGIGWVALGGVLLYFINKEHDSLREVAITNERYEQTNTLIKTLITVNTPSNDDLALSFYRSMLNNVKSASDLADLAKKLNDDEGEKLPSSLRAAIMKVLEKHNLEHIRDTDALRVISATPLLYAENRVESISAIKQLSYNLSFWLRNEIKAQDDSVS